MNNEDDVEVISLKMELFLSVLAGIILSVGVYTYFTIDNKYIGALTYSISIITVLISDLSLFSTRTCFTKYYGFLYLMMLFICNSAGVIATSLLSKLCMNDTVRIEEFIKSKMDRTPTEIIISAVFYGLIIGMCTIGFKMTNNLLIPVIATIAVIFTGLNDVLSCIYCLAIYNYSMSTLNIVLFISMVFIGNVIGGILSSFLNLSYLKEEV